MSSVLRVVHFKRLINKLEYGGFECDGQAVTEWTHCPINSSWLLFLAQWRPDIDPLDIKQ